VVPPGAYRLRYELPVAESGRQECCTEDNWNGKAIITRLRCERGRKQEDGVAAVRRQLSRVYGMGMERLGRRVRMEQVDRATANGAKR